MKKIILITLLSSILLLFSIAPIFTPDKSPSLSAISPTIKANGVLTDEITISADKAILIEKETGFVLYSKNPDSPCGMASTTKIMTAIVILENMNLTDEITATKDCVGIEGSSIYLAEGEIFTVESLLYGLLLESGNDAATALAIGMSKSVENFSKAMNSFAKKLGMTNSNFANPHGLSDEKHYTTARDLAILSSYAMENETFRKIVSTQKTIIKPINGENVRYCTNHNKLLGTYEGLTGIKTGYTKADGKCLVTSAIQDDTELICVTLNGADNWNDHKTLLSKGFEKFKKRTLAKKGEYAFEISVVGGIKNFVIASNSSDIILPIPENEKLEFKVVMPPFVYSPIKIGDLIGEVRIYCSQGLIYSFPLRAENNVEVKKVSFFKKIFG